jgi:hypothetical protein
VLSQGDEEEKISCRESIFPLQEKQFSALQADVYAPRRNSLESLKLL